jgi:hypothetical protein
MFDTREAFFFPIVADSIVIFQTDGMKAKQVNIESSQPSLCSVLHSFQLGILLAAAATLKIADGSLSRYNS